MYVNGSGPELKYAGASVFVGEFGNINPIGAIQTSSGYEIAWKIPSVNEYTFWATDSNGNYTGNLTGLVSGTDPIAQQFETTFHQNFTGTVTSGTAGAILMLAAATPVAVLTQTAFDGTTLTLQQPSTFGGADLSASPVGTLSGPDKIDLQGKCIRAVHSSFDAMSGTLSVSDGSTIAVLHFLFQMRGITSILSTTAVAERWSSPARPRPLHRQPSQVRSRALLRRILSCSRRILAISACPSLRPRPIPSNLVRPSSLTLHRF